MNSIMGSMVGWAEQREAQQLFWSPDTILDVPRSHAPAWECILESSRR